MTAQGTIAAEDIFEINPVFLFRWEEQEQAYLLLYPEGIIKLNGSAGEILKLCTGERSVTDIVQALGEKFEENVENLDGEVRKFLEVSFDKGWIRRAA